LIAVALAALALAAPAPAAPRPGSEAARKPALGVDVSRLERRIDWDRVAASGVEFAIVQASRGDGGDCAVRPQRCGTDPYYARNHADARAAGIPVGAYHRAFAGGNGDRAVGRDARREARIFVARVGSLRGGDLLPALDVEPPFGGLSQRELRRWVRVWLRYVRERLGAKALIYTSASAWHSLGDTREFARRGHRLWVAHWRVSRPAVPAGNWDGRGWAVWQFTNDRRVPGIAGLPDADRLRGGIASIKAR
jgi:lysozyme